MMFVRRDLDRLKVENEIPTNPFEATAQVTNPVRRRRGARILIWEVAIARCLNSCLGCFLLNLHFEVPG